MVNLKAAWQELPDGSKEAIVEAFWVNTSLIPALGYGQNESIPEFSTSAGFADHALRKNISDDDHFLHTKTNPDVLIEVKGRDINLEDGSRGHISTLKQLKRYLSAKECTSVNWGIISNSLHIQLFRKHGKVIHPATPCLPINPDNVEQVVQDIKQKIESQHRALKVAVYNNKGGIGKTTTVINLAAILTLAEKRVLVVDFDPNQQDLTHGLGMQLDKDAFYQCLAAKDKNLKPAIRPHRLSLKDGRVFEFDVVPADEELAYGAEDGNLRTLLRPSTLAEAVESVQHEYDYILIDAPPNWRRFSQNAIYAADVVLIPTKHNSIFSMKNAAIAIKDYIPQIQQARNDGGPIALPIFFNGESISLAQKKAAQKALLDLCKQHKQEINLLPYFFPHCSKANENLEVFEVPAYANIANAAFATIPAVYRDKTARAYYKNLAKEYFLQ